MKHLKRRYFKHTTPFDRLWIPLMSGIVVLLALGQLLFTGHL